MNLNTKHESLAFLHISPSEQHHDLLVLPLCCISHGIGPLQYIVCYMRKQIGIVVGPTDQ